MNSVVWMLTTEKSQASDEFGDVKIDDDDE